MAPLSALCELSDFKLVHLNSLCHNGEIVQLQSALKDDYNKFQEKSNTYHISESIIGRFFPNLVLVRSLRRSFIDSFSSERNAATLRKVLAPFSVSHMIAIDSYLGVSLSFFLSLDFIAISDCVFNNKNNYELGHTGYQIINI